MTTKTIYPLLMSLLLPLSVAAAGTDQSEVYVDCTEGSTPTVLAYGENAVGGGCLISGSLDTDRFQFTAEQGDRIYITLTELEGGSIIYGEINSPSNVKSNFNTAGSTTSKFPYTAIESGVYTISLEDNVPVSYRLQIDSKITALDDNPLQFDAISTHEIEFSGDRDYFAMNLEAGDNIEFTLTEAHGLSVSSAEILDENHSRVGFDSTSGSTTATINFLVTESGTYFVEVTDTVGGTYNIYVSCTGVCPNPTDPQPSLDFLAGKEVGLEEGYSEGYDSGVEAAKVSVNADLDITIPYATWTPAVGDPIDLSAELTFKDGKWELLEYTPY